MDVRDRDSPGGTAGVSPRAGEELGTPLGTGYRPGGGLGMGRGGLGMDLAFWGKWDG